MSKLFFGRILTRFVASSPELKSNRPCRLQGAIRRRNEYEANHVSDAKAQQGTPLAKAGAAPQGGAGTFSHMPSQKFRISAQMRLSLVCSLMFVSLLGLAGTSVSGRAIDGPLVRNEHPRLWMTLSNRAAMKARVARGGEWNREFQDYVNYLTGTEVWNSTATNPVTVSNWAAGTAFVYQMWVAGLTTSDISFPSHANTQAQWAAKAVELTTRIAGDRSIFGDYTRDAFLAYDWIHDQLTSGQRSTIINSWKTQIQADPVYIEVENAFPAYSGWDFDNSVHSGTYGFWVLACLAARGDGVEEAFLQTGCDRYNWAFHASSPSKHQAMVTRESQRAGTDGGTFQGSYYLQVLVFRVGIMEVAWRTANGISVADHYANGERDWIRSWVPYTVRQMWPYHANPSGESRWIGGDMGYNQYDSTGNRSFRQAAAIARFEFPGWDQDATDLAIWFLESRTSEEGDPAQWYMTKFLSPKGTGKSPSTLGLSGDKAYRAGKWQFRTGWDSVNDVLINIYAWRWGALAGAGAFTLSYGGATMPMGAIRNHDLDGGTNSYGKAVLNFVDPNRTTCEMGVAPSGCNLGEDYGSQRFNNGSDIDYQTLTPGTTGDYDTSPVYFRPTTTDGVGYLTLNLTRHYNGPTVKSPAAISEKVSSYRRSFIYFPPAKPGTDSAVLFLFDSATAVSTTFEKRLVLGCATEQTINGSSTPGPSRNGSTDRKTTYTGATNILCSQNVDPQSGATRYYATPLAPTGFTVVKVQYKYDDTNRLCETSYGTVHGGGGTGCYSAETTSTSELRAFSTRWRTEIIPTIRQLTDNFATAIEACPNTTCSRSSTESVIGTNFVGGRVGGAIAIQAVPNLSSGGTFVLTTPGTYRLFIGGLGLSTSRTFTGGVNIGKLTVVGGGECNAGCIATPEGTLAMTVVVSAAGTGASNTITVGPAVGGRVVEDPVGPPAARPAPAPPTNLRIIR